MAHFTEISVGFLVLKAQSCASPKSQGDGKQGQLMQRNDHSSTSGQKECPAPTLQHCQKWKLAKLPSFVWNMIAELKHNCVTQGPEDK